MTDWTQPIQARHDEVQFLRRSERKVEARKLDELKALLRAKLHQQWLSQVRQRAG